MVHGSSRLARILGIPPIIVGLTIVALGTSMPEFLVSMIAALKNKPDLALGNIIGSNVSNLGLILGLSALARPIAVHLKLLKFEVPLLVGVSVYFWIICFNGTLSRFDGLTLTLGFIIYLVIVISGAKKGSDILEKKYNPLKSEKKANWHQHFIYHSRHSRINSRRKLDHRFRCRNKYKNGSFATHSWINPGGNWHLSTGTFHFDHCCFKKRGGY